MIEKWKVLVVGYPKSLNLDFCHYWDLSTLGFLRAVVVCIRENAGHNSTQKEKERERERERERLGAKSWCNCHEANATVILSTFQFFDSEERELLNYVYKRQVKLRNWMSDERAGIFCELLRNRQLVKPEVFFCGGDIFLPPSFSSRRLARIFGSWEREIRDVDQIKFDNTITP
jgi:hypothetical protein